MGTALLGTTRTRSELAWCTLYMWWDDVHATNRVHHASSNYSTCLLSANLLLLWSVLTLHSFVNCHKKRISFFPFSKSFSSSYPQGPRLEMLKLLTHLKAEFVRKPLTFYWISWCHCQSGQAPRQRSIFQHMPACVHILARCTYISLHTSTATLTLVLKLIVMTCAETHLNLWVCKNKSKILVFDVEWTNLKKTVSKHLCYYWQKGATGFAEHWKIRKWEMEIPVSLVSRTTCSYYLQ